MSRLKNKTHLMNDRGGEIGVGIKGGATGTAIAKGQQKTMAASLRQPVLRHAVPPRGATDTRTLSAADAAALEGETSFETLAQIIGFEPARRLTAEHGGRRLYLPERLSHRHPLIKLLARPAAEALRNAFGPGWITVPLGPNATALQRRRRIQAMSEAGYTVVAIAETLGVHTRTVERHRAALKAEGDYPPGK